MNRIYSWVCLVFIALSFGCNESETSKGLPADTRTSGTIRISVDESFRPVMEEELKVFKASNPKANIIASFKPEVECLKDLSNDSIRMVFVTRGLTYKEVQYYQGRLQYSPSFEILAYDAVAIIVNIQAPDTGFTVDQLSGILQGKPSPQAKVYTSVFDGLTATSTVRYALDSVLKGAGFGSGHVFAASNSTGVIDYVANHPDAIGYVGVNWIGNPEDSVQADYRGKVRIASIQCALCPDQPYLYPTQEQILTNRYSFRRGLYYIMKENYDGLGTGFADFLKYQRGQLIFRRAYLVPAILPFNVRTAKVQ
jgi:phosphate transport system substrate-binding protein